MGRKRIPIRKIKDEASLHITYSKRKCGLIRKSYELSILTGAKVAFISFSEAHRLNFFSGVNRIEDTIEQYVRSPKFLDVYTREQQERALKTINLIREQNGTNSSYHAEAMALGEAEKLKQEELKKAMDSLKNFQVDEDEIKATESISKIKRHETFLIDTLKHFSYRKMSLLGTYSWLNGPSNSQNKVGQSRSWWGRPSQVQNQLRQNQERQLPELLNEQNNFVQSHSILAGPSQIQNSLPQNREWQLPELLNRQTHANPNGTSNFIPVQMNWSQQGPYNTAVQRRFQPAYDLDNILSQHPSQHLSFQNACTSNTLAPQASTSYAFQGMAAEPTKAGANMQPLFEPRIEEFDYSSMFTEDHHFSNDLYF